MDTYKFIDHSHTCYRIQSYLFKSTLCQRCVAGYCIGFLWLVFTVWLLNKIEKYSLSKMSPEIRPAIGDVKVA